VKSPKPTTKEVLALRRAALMKSKDRVRFVLEPWHDTWCDGRGRLFQGRWINAELRLIRKLALDALTRLERKMDGRDTATGIKMPRRRG